MNYTCMFNEQKDGGCSQKFIKTKYWNGCVEGETSKNQQQQEKKKKGNKVNCLNIVLVEYVSTFFGKIFGLK